MSTTIIGLSGKKGTGKNTVATMIAALSGLRVKELAFADPLKEEVAKATGNTVKYVNEHKENFRLILQGWGTDYKRKLVDDSYWLNKMGVMIHNAINDGAEIIVITDVRFPNEYNYINKIGGLLCRVSRPLESIDNHPSETALDKVHNWHHIILNTGTLEELRPQVEELITKCKL